MDIKSLISQNRNKEELKSTLLSLKLYKDLTRKLGNRGKEIYKNHLENTSSYKVEYFTSLSKSFVLEEALNVYKKIFKDDVLVSKIKLIQKDNIDGGIRVYKDDNLVDISYKKIGEYLR